MMQNGITISQLAGIVDRSFHSVWHVLKRRNITTYRSGKYSMVSYQDAQRLIKELMPNDEFVSSQEAQEVLGLSHHEQLRRLMACGMLTGRKSGEYWMVERQSLERLRAARDWRNKLV